MLRMATLGTFTYSYSLTDSGSNTGKLTISSEWKNEDDTDTPDEEDLDYPGSNGHMLRDDFSMNLIFTDFYNGNIRINPGRQQLQILRQARSTH